MILGGPKSSISIPSPPTGDRDLAILATGLIHSGDKLIGATGHASQSGLIIAAEPRAGEFQAAVLALTESGARWKHPPCRAQANVFLAMAHHRLGDAEEARRTLALADRDLASVPAQTDPVTLLRAWHWRERTLAQILRREAGELLGIPPRPGSELKD